MQKRNITNFCITIISQIVLFAFAFFIPKILISILGSEVNGFVSTVDQLFVYVLLVEAGVGNACLNALYKPIADKDNETISSILSATKKTFNKIAIIYFLISVVIGFTLPLLIKSSLSYFTMVGIIILKGLGGSVVFLIESTIRQLLIADGRHFLKEITHALTYGLSSTVEIALVIAFKKPILVEIGYVVMAISSLALYCLIFKKKYKTISLKAKPDYSRISDKKYFLIHQVSGAIFSGTDLILVSIFCGLNQASIYSVYALVFNAIGSISLAVMTSLQFNIGQKYNGDKEAFKKYYDKFEGIYNSFIFALFTVAFLMVQTFVKIYTKNADINYVDIYMPFLFFTINILSYSRQPALCVIAVSGNAKNNIWQTIVEAAINLCVSIVGVIFLGVYGVLLGTICALLFRTTQVVFFANKKIMNRLPGKFYCRLVCNILIFVLLILLGNALINSEISIIEFVRKTIAMTVLSLVLFLSPNIIFQKE